MPNEMNTVIATRLMRRTRPDGVVSNITIEIGTPTQTPANSPDSGMWYCPARIVGITGFEEVITQWGTDSVGAISMALTTMAHLLTVFPFVNEINFSFMPNFGFAVVARPVEGATLTGTVTLENCNDPEQNVTFEFRPQPGGTPTVLKHVLTPTGTNTGTFKLEGIPDGTYTLAVKAYSWLRKVIPNVIVANGSDVSGLTVTLPSGDVNNSNAIDISDLNQIVSRYNQLGDP